MSPTPPCEPTAVPCGAADPLSDVLDAVRLRSFVASRNEFTAPWGVRVPRHDEDVPGRPTPPGTQCGGFYVITEGACWFEPNGASAPTRLAKGDIVVALREQGHVLRDDASTPVVPVWELRPDRKIRDGLAVIHGGGGILTTFIAGVFVFKDRECNRIFSALPSHIYVKAHETETAGWLEQALGGVARESARFRPGTQALLNQLTHIVLVQAIRAHVSRLPADSGNWLLALLDPDIGHAIARIQSEPQRPWTVASLADSVAMSRSAFAARFTLMVGEPPLQYIWRARMARATELLAGGQSAVKQVAARVGYESEASFSKAFKRVYGVAPGIYRKEASVQWLRPSSRSGPVMPQEDQRRS